VKKHIKINSCRERQFCPLAGRAYAMKKYETSGCRTEVNRYESAK
jgi:hypothetical protein